LRATRALDDGLTGSLLACRVSVSNLMLGAHPSCRWFVQTTGSNWNRLINEIRSTDGVRKDAPWIDIQPGEWRKKRSMRGKASRQ
jgi:hypothetical protein